MKLPLKDSNLPTQEIILRAKLRNKEIAKHTKLNIRTIERAMGGNPVSKKTAKLIKRYFKAQTQEYGSDNFYLDILHKGKGIN